MSGTAVYFYYKVSVLKASPNAAAEKEAADIVARVGKLILLPEGETPTVASVNDPAKLKDQPFFARAKAGDKVLLYQSSGRAYLYDPSANKILEVAPIILGTGAQQVKAPTKSTSSIKKKSTSR